jgi:phenylacetate-CoA ligase
VLTAFDPWLTGIIAAEVASASHAGAEALAGLRSRRLAGLLASATRDSPFYRRRLRGANLARPHLPDLPIVHKGDLMRQFDDWVTDSQLRLDDLRRFVADRSLIAEPFLGRYVVWTSSGSSGEPGIFVQDAAAMAVYDALQAWRRPSPRPLSRWLDPWYLGERIAFVGATGGHFASTVSSQRLRRLNPALAASLHEVSFLQSTQRLVAELQTLSPTVLSTYPSVALMLAEERLAGRLRLGLREVWTGGENLSPATRRLVQEAFGCPVVDSYGASEFLPLASECRCGRLHLNTDWAILEPVDESGLAVPADETGATTLLTNLANHVQPLIRYDIGDRIKLHSQRCACGSCLPVIEVQGRSDDSLLMRASGRQPVRVSPLALCTVLEDDANLFDFQLEQQGPCELLLCTPAAGEPARATLRRARGVLETFLAQQGVPGVQIRCQSGRPNHRGTGGKVQRVTAMRGRLISALDQALPTRAVLNSVV